MSFADEERSSVYYLVKLPWRYGTLATKYQQTRVYLKSGIYLSVLNLYIYRWQDKKKTELSETAQPIEAIILHLTRS